MSAPARLHAPRENGAILADPSLADVSDLLKSNQQQALVAGPAVLGRSWEDLRACARQTALAAARQYLEAAGEPVPPHAGPGVVMAGHQPELFHPGVWIKNFALNAIGRREGAVSLNLIVDNDAPKTLALSVPVAADPLPSIDDFQPYIQTIPLDRGPNEAPYEERAVRDEAFFASFADRVMAVVLGGPGPLSEPTGGARSAIEEAHLSDEKIASKQTHWGFTPILPAFWNDVCDQAARTRLLGERLTAARRAWERRWGCHNLEVPVGRLCQTEAFAWFACDLLAQASRFRAVYNACVREYRDRYSVRSRNHPAPDLIAEEDWEELPFWAWRSGQTRRGRLLVRRREGGMELRVGAERWPTLPVPTAENPGALAAAWRELERRGFKIRSRALTNTLYVRLFLCDLFMHGIGGGKYDEVTDAIIRRYYGIEPPRYMVLSGTLLLPFANYPADPSDCRKFAYEARDCYYNPQRRLGGSKIKGSDPQKTKGSDPVIFDPLGSARTSEHAAELIAAKEAWIAAPIERPTQRRERFQMLQSITRELRSVLDGRIQTLRQETARCRKQVEANAILQRRDYAFCLHPEQTLRTFCTQIEW